MKLLKKIVPLAVTALMLGTGFAVAADLSNWKASFPGADTAIVVGAGAAAQDTIAAVDIATALGVTSGSTAPVEGAHLIEAVGNDLTYGEDLYDVEDVLDSSDLPTLLADGTYKESTGKTSNDVTYKQFLYFTDGTGIMNFTQNTEATNKPVDTYLVFKKQLPAYTYKLVFDNPVKFNTADVDKDLKLTKLKMLGREYTIVDASVSGGIIDSLTLMAGVVKATQDEYETKTYTLGDKTYEVKVKIINDDDQTVVLAINGETTDELNEGATYTLDDGTVVGIIDVMPNEAGEEGKDMVTFYLGAEKIVLSQGKEVEINDKSIDGSNADLANNAAPGQLSEIDLSFAPEDNIFLAKGESLTDSILGRFKITYQGLVAKTETVSLTTNGDEGTLELKNKAGNTLEIPFVLDDKNKETFPGDEFIKKTEAIITQDGRSGTDGNGNLLIADGDSCTGTSAVTDCEGIKLLVVGKGGEARIIEIKDIDTTHHTVDLKEVSPGSQTWNDRDYTSNIPLGFATINLTVSGDTITANDINTCSASVCNAGDFLTSLGGEIDIEFNGTNANGYVFRDNGTSLAGETGGTADPLFSLIDDSGDLAINIGPGLNKLNWMTEEKKSDYKVAIDNLNWGAIFRFDSKDNNELTWTYPEEEVTHKVYVSEVLTTIPKLGTGNIVGGASVAVLDTEINEVKDKNLIVVGGSAINRVAAELLGLSFPTYGDSAAWKEATGVDGAGKAIIKLMNSPYASGKYALLVAGWEGVDTQRAAKALKEGTPALSGTSKLLSTATSTVTVITA